MNLPKNFRPWWGYFCLLWCLVETTALVFYRHDRLGYWFALGFSWYATIDALNYGKKNVFDRAGIRLAEKFFEWKEKRQLKKWEI